MMLLGIVLHGAGFYMAAPPRHFHMPVDHDTSYAADLLFYFIHEFRMPTFFVLAGFFAALLVERRGLWGMYRDRGARVVAPMFAGIVSVVPLAMLFMLDFMLATRYGSGDIIPSSRDLLRLREDLVAEGVPMDPSIGHLWFLYYLCHFYLAVPLCRLVAARLPQLDSRLTRNAVSRWAFVLLAMGTTATLWPFRGGQALEGFLYLTPHWPSLVYYGLFFLAGYVAYEHRGFLDAAVRFAPACAGFALVLFPISVYLSHLDNQALGSVSAYHLGAVVTHGLCTWALIYAFVGAAVRLLDRPSPWTLYAAQSAYWVYLVHMPFACFAAWALVGSELDALMKMPAVMAFTAVMSFVTYHYGVRATWIGRFLNGRRFDRVWPWRVAEARVSVPVNA
jgi:glucans biosynthesis protein C